VIEAPMTTADPRFALSNYDAKLAKLIAPGLTSVDTPDALPRLELARAIDRIDDTTYDVTLGDARFSDGQPVTATDVARTYESVMDPSCGSLHEKNFRERFTSVEAIDPSRVRFHLALPLATFVTDIEFGVISYHGVPAGECRPPRVLGAGPYQLAELTSRHVVLDANPYATPHARTPHVEIRFVPDDAARTLMLVGGSADLLQNAARPDLVDDIALRPRVTVQAAPSVLLTYMLLNNDDPALRDVRVRQAIALALDRPAIIAAKFGGRAVLATGLLPPASWAYEPDVVRYDRDLPRARALLDAAGLPPGPGGVRLHLTYKTSAVAFRVAIARLLAQQLADVGIEVELRPFEFATLFADVKRGSYQIASMQSPEITEPDFYRWFFHSNGIPDARNPDGSNRWRYRNADIDAWTEAARRQLDRDARKALYARIQRKIAEDVPIVPLWHEDNVVLANRDVHGYTIVPNARFIGLAGVTKGDPAPQAAQGR